MYYVFFFTLPARKPRGKLKSSYREQFISGSWHKTSSFAYMASDFSYTLFYITCIWVVGCFLNVQYKFIEQIKPENDDFLHKLKYLNCHNMFSARSFWPNVEMFLQFNFKC